MSNNEIVSWLKSIFIAFLTSEQHRVGLISDQDYKDTLVKVARETFKEEL